MTIVLVHVSEWLDVCCMGSSGGQTPSPFFVLLSNVSIPDRQFSSRYNWDNSFVNRVRLRANSLIFLYMVQIYIFFIHIFYMVFVCFRLSPLQVSVNAWALPWPTGDQAMGSAVRSKIRLTRSIMRSWRLGLWNGSWFSVVTTWSDQNLANRTSRNGSWVEQYVLKKHYMTFVTVY